MNPIQYFCFDCGLKIPDNGVCHCGRSYVPKAKEEPDMDKIALIAELKAMREERDKLKAACAKSLVACQDNLKMYQYKNEPLLHEAFLMCRDALGDEGMRLQRQGNPCSPGG